MATVAEFATGLQQQQGNSGARLSGFEPHFPLPVYISAPETVGAQPRSLSLPCAVKSQMFQSC